MITLVRPSEGRVPLGLRELWEYRELVYFLVWRDVKVRYKQTALGAAWAILQPFLTMLIFSVFLGRLVKVPSDGVPYPLFTYAGLLPWTYFSQALGHASDSLVGSASLISKVYFPRLIVPLAAVAAGLVDLVIACTVLIGMMAYYGVQLTPAALLLPIPVALAVAAALGAGLWLSAANVRYRDVRYVVPFLSQCWLFLTPVAYPSSLLAEPWRTLYGANPMSGVVDSFRCTLLGTNLSWSMFLLSVVVTAVLLSTGILYFRATERTFADTV